MHRDGDWHRSVHVWVVDTAEAGRGAARVLLQRRSEHKDTYPGHWDVSVAGHVEAGDGPSSPPFFVPGLPHVTLVEL